MSTDNLSTEENDHKILEKFSKLLSKYQNQGQSLGTIPKLDTDLTGSLPENIDAREKSAHSIPVLTEIVAVQPAVIQPQRKRSSLLVRQILDAALEESNIEMSIDDRSTLARALEIRLKNR